MRSMCESAAIRSRIWVSNPVERGRRLTGRARLVEICEMGGWRLWAGFIVQKDGYTSGRTPNACQCELLRAAACGARTAQKCDSRTLVGLGSNPDRWRSSWRHSAPDSARVVCWDAPYRERPSVVPIKRRHASVEQRAETMTDVGHRHASSLS